LPAIGGFRLKKRWLFPVLAVIIGLIVLSQLWDLIQFNQSVKKAILKRAAPYLGAELSIQRVSLGFGSLHIRGLLMRDKKGIHQLFIRDIKIVPDWMRLIRTHFDFAQSVKRIEFVKPRLTLSLPKPASGAAPALPGTSRAESRSASGGFDLSRFPIDSIKISKGSVVFSDSALRYLSIENIGGTLAVGRDSHCFSLSGRLPGTDTRTFIAGVMDPSFKTFDVTLALSKASLIKAVPLGQYVSLNSGQIDIQFHAWKSAEQPLEATSMTGKILFNHLSLALPGKVALSDLTGQFTLTDSGLTVDRCDARLFDRPVTLSGSVNHPFNPQFSLQYKAVNLDLSHPDVKKLLHENRLSGQVSLEGSVCGPLGAPQIRAELRSSRVWVAGAPFGRPAIDLRLHHDSLIVTKAAAECLSGALTAQGGIHLADPYAMVMSLTLKSADLLKLTGGTGGARASTFTLSLAIQQDKNRLRLTGSGHGSFTRHPELGPFNLALHTQGRNLVFSLRNEAQSIALSGTLAEFADKPDINARLSLSKLDMNQLTGSENLVNPDRFSFSADFRAVGPPAGLRLAGSVYAKGEWTGGTLLVNGSVEDLLAPAPVAHRLRSIRPAGGKRTVVLHPEAAARHNNSRRSAIRAIPEGETPVGRGPDQRRASFFGFSARARTHSAIGQFQVPDPRGPCLGTMPCYRLPRCSEIFNGPDAVGRPIRRVEAD